METTLCAQYEYYYLVLLHLFSSSCPSFPSLGHSLSRKHQMAKMLKVDA